jgi:catechol 2,3-dioxygenase-like lactoylglutathione lyase family enzyme
MPVNRVLAALAVADIDSALHWYERLLGRPADALPIGVDDLNRELLTLRERGLDPGSTDDPTSDKVLFATVTDLEGNAITLVEQR